MRSLTCWRCESRGRYGRATDRRIKKNIQGHHDSISYDVCIRGPDSRGPRSIDTTDPGLFASAQPPGGAIAALSLPALLRKKIQRRAATAAVNYDAAGQSFAITLRSEYQPRSMGYRLADTPGFAVGPG